MVSPMMASVPPSRSTRLRVASAPFRMFTTGLESDPFPIRGLMYSLVVHFLFALTTLAVPWGYWIPSRAHLAITQPITATHAVLLLPRLEPMGADGPASHFNAGGEQHALEESLVAKAMQGVVYNGPQLIVSNPPHPDNFVQTIRQPSIAELPKLPSPLPLPPMVQVAPAPSEISRPVVPVLTPAAQTARLSQEQPKIDPPRLPLAASSAADLPLGTARATVPTLAPKPALPDQSGSQTKSLLVINAFSDPELKPSAIPPGELHGAFTVSPAGSTSVGLAGGGTAQSGAPGMSNASLSGSSAYAENGASKSPAGSTVGTSVKAGVGPGIDGGQPKSASARSSSGAGNGARASGNGRGTGTAAGGGNSPFPMVMIQGGSGTNGKNTGAPSGSASADARPGYGITIVSSGASGGGFRDFGVFRNEASYTVYVDMGDAGVHGSWTMQYALDTHRAPGMADPPQRAHGALVPPYASTKSIPHYPQSPYRRRMGMAVVFGVIGPEGRFNDLRIMQSPDTGLNQSLLDSLREWVFRPAEMDGARVAVKVLLGVPVSSLPE